MQTRAVDKGDHYLINGRKLWITNGNEAEILSCSRMQILKLVIVESLLSSSKRVSKDSRSVKKRTNWEFARLLRQN